MNINDNNNPIAMPMAEDNSKIIEEIENYSTKLETMKIAALEKIADNTTKIYELLKEILSYNK